MSVAITRSGLLVSVSGLTQQMREALQTQLQYKHHSMEPDGRGGIKPAPVMRRLWATASDGSLLTNCGFVARIYRVVESMGGEVVSYERTDRPDRVLTPDMSCVDCSTWREGQVDMLSNFVAHEGGLIVSPTGCHRKGQHVLLADGRQVSVEDVEVGHRLMGPDGRPRKVLGLRRGRGQMAEIEPKKGDPWVVNLDHVLTLVRTTDGSLVDVSVRRWLQWFKAKKHMHKMIRAGAVELRAVIHLVPPYAMGLFLGDGGFTDSKTDKVLHKALMERAGLAGVSVELRRLGLWGMKPESKFIPDEYLRDSVNNRRELLSGLLDTDGSYSTGCYEYSSASKKLAEGVAYVARSLGLAAYVSNRPVDGKIYYRVSISGDFSSLSLRIVRKEPNTRRQAKDVLRCGFDVKLLGVENYYGFMLSDDGRYLLSDFTVTHNSGKSYGLREICAMYPHARIVITAPGIDPCRKAAQYVRERLPGQVGEIGGGRRSSRRITVTTFNSLTKVDYFNEIDILIVDEVHRAPAKSYAEALGAMGAPLKRFGFTATADGRYDNAELVNEGLFGPILVDIPYYEAVARGEVVPIHCIVHQHSLGPSREHISSIKSIPRRDKLALWRNDARNRLVVDDVRQVLEEQPDAQVLVLVSKVDHLYNLYQYLQPLGFVAVTGNLSKKKVHEYQRNGVPITYHAITNIKKRDWQRRQFETGQLRRVIATEVWSQAVSADECSVTFFAAGSGSSISCLQTLGRASRVDNERGKTLGTVVVYRDMFHSAYQRRADTLIRAIRKQGHAITVVS